MKGARGRRPTLSIERTLFADGHRLVAGMDEVGRGALAGPVSVGVALVTPDTTRIPSGLRDSKLVTPQLRSQLVPRITRWAAACAVGHATPSEIDDVGIIAALRIAGRRALAQLPRQPSVVVLDGNFDWLGRAGQADLFDADAVSLPPVVTKIKADVSCASVAAASVLAKTERDSYMVRLSDHFAVFRWHENKGYAAPEHRAAIDQFGPTRHHRRSWRLGSDHEPGAADPDDDAWEATA